MLATVMLATVMLAIEGFPIDDWQFWAGTMVFLGSLAVLLRPVLRGRRKGKDAGCGGCAAAPRRSSAE